MLHGKHLIPNLFVLWHVNPNILFLFFCYVQKSKFMKDIQAKSGLSGIYRDIQIIQWSQNMYSIACQIQQCKTLNNQFCDKMAKQTRVTGGTYIYYLYESKIMMAQMTEFWFQTTNKNEYNFTCTMKPASTSHKFFSSSWGCRTERGRWSGGLCGYRLRLSDDQWRECRRDRNDKAGFGLDNSVLKRCWLWR